VKLRALLMLGALCVMNAAWLARPIVARSSCCCSKMPAGSCPLKRHAQRSCDPHGARTCSLSAPVDHAARVQTWSDESRFGSTAAEDAFCFTAPSSSLSFLPHPAPARASRSDAPELPPPRMA